MNTAINQLEKTKRKRNEKSSKLSMRGLILGAMVVNALCTSYFLDGLFFKEIAIASLITIGAVAIGKNKSRT